MKNILFRVDSSVAIGTGHVYRCRNLARELKARGASVSFICRSQQGDLINVLNEEFCVLILPPSLHTTQNIGPLIDSVDINDYSSWLGCPQLIDASETINSIVQSGILPVDWLIVDHYSLDKQWESAVLSKLSAFHDQVPSIMVIDDLANRSHLADILVDQNYYGSSSHGRYQGLTPLKCNVLSGPHYALLSPEYSLLSRTVVPRQELHRIVVFFGGSDSFNCSLLTVKALARGQFSHLQIDVVMGNNSSGREQIAAISQRYPNIHLYNPLPSLAAMFMQADLAIGAGGVTTWERCCLSLPSIVITIADNQTESMSYLSSEKSIKLLGCARDVSEEDIRSAVMECMENIGGLSSGGEYLDGFGVPLVVNSLLCMSPDLTLRNVLFSDKCLLWRWANEFSVRSNSFSSGFISLSDHELWFTAGLKSPDRLHWIAMDIHRCPVGQLRLDRDHVKRTISIDFSLDLAVRGQGFGSKLILKALKLIPVDWMKGYRLIAQIMNSNHASQASFVKAGFKPLDSSIECFTSWVWYDDI